VRSFTLVSSIRCDKISVTAAAKYIVDKGIAEESAYPYKGTVGACKTSTIKPTFFFQNIATCFLNATTESLIKMFLFRHGPVLLFISKNQAFRFFNKSLTLFETDTNRPSLLSYSSGVYNDAKCTGPSTSLVVSS
jgi:Papain family cysteine protease